MRRLGGLIVFFHCYIRKVSSGSKDFIKGNNIATYLSLHSDSRALENAFLIAAHKCKFIIINTIILLYYSFSIKK